MNTELLKALASISGILGQANVAVPIIFGTISAIAAIVRGFTGNGPSLSELATVIEGVVDANDARGQAEVARLKEQIANGG